MSKTKLALLPPTVDLETKRILKNVNKANRELAVNWGEFALIRNQSGLNSFKISVKVQEKMTKK